MRQIVWACVGAVMLACGAASAQAAELKVLTAGAMKSVVVALQGDFEKQTGHRLSIDNDTAGALQRRIIGGEALDVAIVTPAVVDDLIAKGKIVAGSKAEVAKVGIGVAVKEGAPVPAISDVAAFKGALLAAKTVAYIDPKSGGSSGIYFDTLLDKLGVGDAVRAKAKLKQGGYVAELVATGEAELAVHQISEILPVKGVVLVGPLPAEVQNYTVYAAGVGASARAPQAAAEFVAFLKSPAAAALLAKRGMSAP